MINECELKVACEGREDMGLSKENIFISDETKSEGITTAKKRRLRRKKLRAARALININNNIQCSNINNTEKKSLPLTTIVTKIVEINQNLITPSNIKKTSLLSNDLNSNKEKNKMSSKGDTDKSRDEVLAAREAKKMVKQKAKKKNANDGKDHDQIHLQSNIKPSSDSKETILTENVTSTKELNENKLSMEKSSDIQINSKDTPSKDEVDRALNVEPLGAIGTEKSKELVKAERAAKKAVKQAKKKGTTESKNQPQNSNIDVSNTEVCNIVTETQKSVKTDTSNNNTGTSNNSSNVLQNEKQSVADIKNSPESDSKSMNDMTVQDMVNTLKDIVTVAREVQDVTDKVRAINLGTKKAEESTKSKVDLKAERRAKQEAQRAAKQAAQQEKPAVIKTDQNKKIAKSKEENLSKPKVVEKSKPKPQSMQKMNWFQHLYTEYDKETLKQMEINSNLHPAVIKLGIQLASHVVTGSNARCIALLDALKKMVRDYSLPARTEFGRGLELQLAASADFLWTMRPPTAAQTNALMYFRHRLTQLPNDVDEFDAKKLLQEDIDRYIYEQIDRAGEAISVAVRNKISNGDNILTYGCSSLIERILREAHEAGIQFRAIVVGVRVQRASRETLRRLVSHGISCTYADISALSFLMRDVSKVLIGAASLLANGAVLAPVGSLAAALVARAHNVPLLVACETHKFSETVQTDAFVYNEIGDPDDIIDKTDENSPLKDWRSNPNLTLLNLTYDVTPPSLVTAVVTDLAILPCTSAPVVLRYKLL